MVGIKKYSVSKALQTFNSCLLQEPVHIDEDGYAFIHKAAYRHLCAFAGKQDSELRHSWSALHTNKEK